MEAAIKRAGHDQSSRVVLLHGFDNEEPQVLDRASPALVLWLPAVAAMPYPSLS